jgi:hypothetical protein
MIFPLRTEVRTKIWIIAKFQILEFRINQILLYLEGGRTEIWHPRSSYVNGN